MTELRGQIVQALHAHRRQHETSMYCECGAWVTGMDTHRADAVTRLVQPTLDRLGSTSAEHEKRANQLEELLAIAHETSNTAETERARLAAEVDRLGDWYRAVSERVTTAEAERDRYHGELAVNETDRVAAVRRAERAEAAVVALRKEQDEYEENVVGDLNETVIGLSRQAARAEAAIARVHTLHQPVGVVAATEHGEPPDCAAGCGDWPCATYTAVTEPAAEERPRTTANNPATSSDTTESGPVAS